MSLGEPFLRIVYQGKFTEDKRRGRFAVMEGVVVKGSSGGPDLWMAKIKTSAYLERLKLFFAEGWQDCWE